MVAGYSTPHFSFWGLSPSARLLRLVVLSCEIDKTHDPTIQELFT